MYSIGPDCGLSDIYLAIMKFRSFFNESAFAVIKAGIMAFFQMPINKMGAMVARSIGDEGVFIRGAHYICPVDIIFGVDFYAIGIGIFICALFHIKGIFEVLVAKIQQRNESESEMGKECCLLAI